MTWHLLLLASGCIGKDFTISFDSGAASPTCATTTTGWTGSADYKFDVTSFACESDPISGRIKANAQSFVDYGAGISTTTEVHADLSVAAAAWNAVGADVQVRHSSSDTVSPGSSWQDSVNQMFMEEGYDTRGLHLAQVKAWYDTSAPEDGYTDCDVTYYSEIGSGGTSATVSWALSNTAESGKYTLARVMMHELGHCLGINDNTLSSTIMYGQVTANTSGSLDTEDHSAMSFLYGP